MDYLKLFQNHSEYEAFVSGGTMMKPNVSHCINENEVHYNNLIIGTITATFNITNNKAFIIGNNSDENPDVIDLYDSSFLSIEVDGEPFSEERLNNWKQYTFPTNGTHTVVYKVKDGILGEFALYNIGDGVESIVVGSDIVEIKNSSLICDVSSITILNDNVKVECHALPNIETMPYENNVRYIGTVAVAANVGSSITTYEIKEGTKLINSYFCEGDNGNDSWASFVTIPSTIECICNDAFRDVTSLTTVVINATTPPSIGERAFRYYVFDDITYDETYEPLENITIYVPAESVNAYKTAPGWSDFASKIQAISN